MYRANRQTGGRRRCACGGPICKTKRFNIYAPAEELLRQKEYSNTMIYVLF